MRRAVIGIMGSALASQARLTHARVLGRLLAEHGWVLLTGGRNVGVMAAATEGAKSVPGSLSVGVLPGRLDDAAEDVDLAIVTGKGDARNAVNVLSSRVIVACGIEGAGTASEVALALKARIPVILLGVERDAASLFGRLGGSLVHLADSPQEAITIIRDRLGVAPGPPWS